MFQGTNRQMIFGQNLEFGKMRVKLRKWMKQNMPYNSFRVGQHIGAPLILGFVISMGLALRFYDLGAESFWLDEVATTIESQQSVREILTSGRMDQPPAYYVPMHFWVKFFGISEVSLRAFSALAGTGSIILVYLVGKKLFEQRVGLLGAFFMAISDFQILFSQEARNYSFFGFATLLSMLLFILFIDSKRKVYFVLYVLGSIFMVYANAFGVFVFIAQNLFLVFQYKRYKNLAGIWIIGQVLILLAIIPYFSPLVFGDGGMERTVAENLTGNLPPSLSDVIRSFYRFILPPRRYFGADMEWGNPLLVTYAIAGTFFAAGVLIYAILQGMRNWFTVLRKAVSSLLDAPDIKRNVLLLSCWLLCPPAILFIVSKTILPAYDHRYVINVAPALYLLLALGLFSVRKAIPLLISMGALLFLIVPGLQQYYATDVREQWKEAATFIEKHEGPNEVLVFAPNDSSVNVGNQLKAFNYHYRGTLPSCGIGPDSLTDAEVLEALESCTLDRDRFWVIIRHTTYSTMVYNRYQTFFLNSNQTAMQLVREQHFFAISAYLFELAE